MSYSISPLTSATQEEIKRQLSQRSSTALPQILKTLAVSKVFTDTKEALALAAHCLNANIHEGLQTFAEMAVCLADTNPKIATQLLQRAFYVSQTCNVSNEFLKAAAVHVQSSRTGLTSRL